MAVAEFEPQPNQSVRKKYSISARRLYNLIWAIIDHEVIIVGWLESSWPRLAMIPARAYHENATVARSRAKKACGSIVSVHGTW